MNALTLNTDATLYIIVIPFTNKSKWNDETCIQGFVYEYPLK